MLTYFLALVIGWYLIFIGLFLILRHQQLKVIMEDMLSHSGLFFIVAIMTVILGLLMVISHNYWVAGWPVIITIFSWTVLLSGLYRLFFADHAKKMGKYVIEKPMRVRLAGLLTMVVGLLLLVKTFVVFM